MVGDTNSPTASPTVFPTMVNETNVPTESPTVSPTMVGDTNAPTVSPTVPPTMVGDTNAPTAFPTVVNETNVPTASPTVSPTTVGDTNSPTAMPTVSPTVVGATNSPTASPTVFPTMVNETNAPTESPTVSPTVVGDTNAPTVSPTVSPTVTGATNAPTASPTVFPTVVGETNAPTASPTVSPTMVGDTNAPTVSPTVSPTVTGATNAPTASPTVSPTMANETNVPSESPTVPPTMVGDTNAPTVSPTVSPTVTGDTNAPTASPTVFPTMANETNVPTAFPTLYNETGGISLSPTIQPSISSSSSSVGKVLCRIAGQFNLSTRPVNGWTCTDDMNPITENGRDVCDDNWTGILCDDGGKISSLDLSGLGLSGTVSSDIGQLTALQSLDLSSNSLRGPLPIELGQLTSLEAFDIHSNEFGSLNRRLGQYSPYNRKLQTSFVDESFTAIANMSSLTFLDVGSNGLTGRVPSSLCALPLRTLILVSTTATTTARNSFDCIAECLTEKEDLTLVVSGLSPCVDTASPTPNPTRSPTVEGNQARSSGSEPVLGQNGVSFVSAAAALFLLLLLCCCYTFCIRRRNQQDVIRKYRDDSIVARPTQVNLMTLRNAEKKQASVSSSSFSSSSESSDSSDESADIDDIGVLEPNAKQKSIAVTVWNNELLDFHKGNVKVSSDVAKMQQKDKIFSFADVYSSSDEPDEDDIPMADVDDLTQYSDSVDEFGVPYSRDTLTYNSRGGSYSTYRSRESYMTHSVREGPSDATRSTYTESLRETYKIPSVSSMDSATLTRGTDDQDERDSTRKTLTRKSSSRAEMYRQPSETFDL